MKTNRAFVLPTIVIVLSILLGACAPAAQPTQAVQPTAAAPAVTAAVPEATAAVPEVTAAVPAVTEAPSQAPAPSGGVVELTYQRYKDNPEDIENQFIKEFNDSHPNIHVTADSVPAVDAYQKILLTTQAGTPPDIFMTHYTVSYATAGLALDLTPFTKAEGDAWNADYTPNGWLFHDYAGSHYGMPWRVSEYMVFINNKLLKKAGLPLPPTDWTWDDFLKYAKAMTHPENQEYGFCFVGASDNATTGTQFGQFLISGGGKHIGDDGLANLSNDATYKTLDFLTGMIDDKLVPPGTASTETTTCTDLLASDKVAMWSNADLWRGTLRSKYKDIDISVVPTPIGAIKGTWVGGTGLAISSKSTHPKEAWEFIKFMTSDDVERRWSKVGGFIPPNANLWKDAAWLAEDPEREPIIKAFGEYKVYPLDGYPEGINLQTILRNYLQAVYLKKMTPQDAMAKATVEWNAILTNYQTDNWWNAWK